MEPTLLKLCNKLDHIISFLKPLLPLANCHMVEFITENHWEKLLPEALTESLDCMEMNDAVNLFWESASKGKENGNTELDKWLRNAQEHYLTADNQYCLTKEQFKTTIKAWGGEIKPEIKVKEFMNSKKSYEVQTMCGLVASLHEVCKTTCCVEVGGGRGPLLTALTLSYGVPSLTVDCDIGNIRAASERAQRMKKQWHVIAKQIQDCNEKTISLNKNEYLHRFATSFVTKNTDLAAITRLQFPEYSNQDIKVLLTGLHTCGNLGPDSLRIFNSQPSTTAIFNVPCCYHLLTEDSDVYSFDAFRRNYGGIEKENKEAGFPMSSHLKGMNLGRNARMLAAQSIDRVVNQRQMPGRSLLNRALLQVLIKKHLPNASLSEGKLKRVSSKCENFEQYFKMADSILKLNLFDKLPKVSLEEIYKDVDEHWKKLVLFYLLRLCLAQVIESVILLDRLLYLLEQGYEKVFLVKLFDPVLSPKCHSIVAIK